MSDILAANKRAEHLALDRLALHDEGVVASGLHSEERPAEGTLGDRNTDIANCVERFADIGWKEYPWTSGSLVEWNPSRNSQPSCHRRLSMDLEARGRDVNAQRRQSSSDDERRIDGCVENLLRIGKIIHFQERRSVLKQGTHASAGERSPEFRRKDKPNRSALSGKRNASLDEQRRDIHLRGKTASSR